jgi:hypothetical protein
MEGLDRLVTDLFHPALFGELAAVLSVADNLTERRVPLGFVPVGCAVEVGPCDVAGGLCRRASGAGFGPVQISEGLYNIEFVGAGCAPVWIPN